MIKVAGVRFRDAGKLYWFDPGTLEIRPGQHVITETARGMEYGTVSGTVRELPEDKVTLPLRRIVRIANEEDVEQAAENRRREREAFAICKEKIRDHGLEMKLIDAEYTFDNSKILFYFTADGRVDFRNLVKDLASVFRTRIELRQIGVRDETKILGGIGICGRPLCCHNWLTDFVPVSIRMAKEQNLSLNPAKISGVCGRLMCCLKNEEETYEYLNSRLPAVGDTVLTPSGAEGVVSQVNVLRQRVKVVIVENDEKEACEYDVEELTFTPRKGRGRKDQKKASGRDGKREKNRSGRDQQEGERSSGDRQEGERSARDKQEDARPARDRQDTERPARDKQETERPARDRQDTERRRKDRQEGARPEKQRQEGARPEKQRQEGTRPEKQRQEGARPEKQPQEGNRPDPEKQPQENPRTGKNQGAEEEDRRAGRPRRPRGKKPGRPENAQPGRPENAQPERRDGQGRPVNDGPAE